MTVIRKQDGFSLTELIVTMVIFVLVIAAASNIFVGILGQYKQQSKITESNIEGLIGLQMLKSDVEQAGFGLPWNLGGATYAEAINSGVTTWDDTLFNDSAIPNPPRPIVLGDGVAVANTHPGSLSNSDVLVVKATSIGTARAAQRWTYITNIAATGNNPAVRWTPDTVNENIEGDGTAANSDRVIVIKAVSGSTEHELVVSGGAFFTRFNINAYTSAAAIAAGFLPVANSSKTHLLYGVGTADLRMPFNRADYYVKRPAVMPSQCSADAGTGILYKATVNHADGGLTELPLLDCVREMQVVFGRDTNNDGATDNWGTALPATAEDIRAQLKEVRIYILAHEGQRDTSYTSTAPITAVDPDFGTVINFNAAGAGLQNFRWKVYTIVAKLHL